MASPFLLLAAPCLLCCRCKNKYFYEEATPLWLFTSEMCVVTQIVKLCQLLVMKFYFHWTAFCIFLFSQCSSSVICLILLYTWCGVYFLCLFKGWTFTVWSCFVYLLHFFFNHDEPLCFVNFKIWNFLTNELCIHLFLLFCEFQFKST